MGSDESHFNVSVGSDGQSHKTVSTNHNLFEEKGDPKRYRTEVLPLTSLTARPNRLTMVTSGSRTALYKNYAPLRRGGQGRAIHAAAGNDPHKRLEAIIPALRGLYVKFRIGQLSNRSV